MLHVSLLHHCLLSLNTLPWHQDRPESISLKLNGSAEIPESRLPPKNDVSMFSSALVLPTHPQVPPPPAMDPAHEAALHQLMEVGYGNVHN